MCDDIIGMEKYHVTQQIKVKRDSEAQIMREVCRDVQTEPTLLPINENDYERKVNTADNARLDVSARGLWNSCEKTFFGI